MGSVVSEQGIASFFLSLCAVLPSASVGIRWCGVRGTARRRSGDHVATHEGRPRHRPSHRHGLQPNPTEIKLIHRLRHRKSTSALSQKFP